MPHQIGDRLANVFSPHAPEPMATAVDDVEQIPVSRNLGLEGANLIGKPRLGPFIKLHVVPIVIFDALARCLGHVVDLGTASRDILELIKTVSQIPP
jgi:hypothetical protein